MLPQDIIRTKRAGGELTEEQIRFFLRGYMARDIGDDQMSALLMATAFRGMSFEETVALTGAFVESGERIDLTGVPGVKVDKHSTGGVGDKVSLLLVPIVAAAGVPVPMISGRTLGHTGGTLDKLESIPGFRTTLTPEQFAAQIRETGAAIAGQSDSIVPADRRIYALRDVTGTIDVPPFIAASILSKKIAEGAEALVLDVKVGGGGFLPTLEEAQSFGSLLARVAERFGIRVAGLATRMDEPLGCTVGNRLEVLETVDCLEGRAQPDLLEVTLALAGSMIHLGKKAASPEEGALIARAMLESGLAYEKFLEIVRAQSGDSAFAGETLAYPNARNMLEVRAPAAGSLSAIDARVLGRIAVELGAGRRRASDSIDPTAGVILRKKVGDRLEEGEALCLLCSSTVDELFPLRGRAAEAFRISNAPVEPRPRILASFDGEGWK